MKRARSRYWLALAIAAAEIGIAGCAGTTSVQRNHPALAFSGASERTTVYFIRPDIGFRGVQNLPVTISIDGLELMKLAKGQYTMLHLSPAKLDLTAEGYTVEGPNNAMSRASFSMPLALSAGERHYILFGSHRPGGREVAPFVMIEINRNEALIAAKGLAPVSVAAGQQLIQ